MMRLRPSGIVLACALAMSAIAQAAGPPSQGGPSTSSGHWAGPKGWQAHPSWGGDIHNFPHEIWRGGHWWHGRYGGRPGWWWIVGPNWFWYPAAIYPYPDPFTPPGAAPGFWYYCAFYSQYYPYVGVCPSDWQPVQPY